jgi:hypothetical protein
MINLSRRLVLPFLLLALLGLLAGLWAGLIRIGFTLPGMSGPLPLSHGPLMISGFLGTLIALERAAALRRRWMFAAPLLGGLGWLTGLLFPDLALGGVLIVLASLVTVFILLAMLRVESKIHTWTMALGACCWLAGNLFWMAGLPISRLVFLWEAFLVLTVAGERLELSRVLRPTPLQHRLFAAAAALYLAGALLNLWLPQPGSRLTGLGLLALAAWLLRFDLARRNLRHPIPLTRYIAVCLFGGYVWLAVGGLLSLALGAQVSGPFYDAILHATLVGFILSMILGHAPIILPALLGTMLTFKKAFYFNLALLHASLALRILGDLGKWYTLRSWGGLLNEVALLLFLGMTVSAVVSANRSARRV